MDLGDLGGNQVGGQGRDRNWRHQTVRLADYSEILQPELVIQEWLGKGPGDPKAIPGFSRFSRHDLRALMGQAVDPRTRPRGLATGHSLDSATVHYCCFRCLQIPQGDQARGLSIPTRRNSINGGSRDKVAAMTFQAALRLWWGSNGRD